MARRLTPERRRPAPSDVGLVVRAGASPSGPTTATTTRNRLRVSKAQWPRARTDGADPAHHAEDRRSHHLGPSPAFPPENPVKVQVLSSASSFWPSGRGRGPNRGLALDVQERVLGPFLGAGHLAALVLVVERGDPAGRADHRDEINEARRVVPRFV
jgi:hypothetical protein